MMMWSLASLALEKRSPVGEQQGQEQEAKEKESNPH